ncbi:Rv0361 family membrane protein [Mycobacteroides chelonae]|uniref:Rv0361 family membrane protein n=1 Tax=Mycobacteroides chelonae TaxID=1774 RepID=UPI000F7A7317|nr:hypothetical protein [Mycobacteroides chelonae]MBF9327892.1 hypothetical protein [Mycobacteroides chelonae]MBF9422070.1 hypothetical protein [Mycobacteroides chelonae]MBF9435741.1 hypothetical protein [Mycobacteroides chelonae]MBV6361982.1 hypothetical protein [Mycobacteroides chelonae]MEC4837324.1 hypothetical protein [Mycobacteroides chelonae]
MINKIKENWVYLLITALIFTALGAGGSFLFQDSQARKASDAGQVEQAIIDVLGAYDDGDYGRAKGRLCGFALENYTKFNKQEAEQQGLDAQRKQGRQKLVNVEVVADGDKAFVLADTYREGDPKSTAQAALFKMERSGGTWRMCSYADMA